MRRIMAIKSIRTQLLIWFLAITLLPLLIVILVTTRTSQELLLQASYDNLTNIADNKLRQVESFTVERQRDISDLAQLPTIRQAIRALRDSGTSVYDAWQAQLTPLIDAPIYRHLFLLDANGDVLFTTQPDLTVGDNIFTRSSELGRVVDQARTLLQSEISGFDFNTENGQVSAYLAAPVFDDGVVSGVVAVEINNDEIFDVIGNTAGLGFTGETVVGLRREADIVFLSPLRYDAAAAFTRTVAVGTAQSNALQDATQGIHRASIVQDYRDVPVVAVSRYVPSLRWGMVVKQDTSEALAAIASQQNTFQVLLVVTFVAVISLAIWAARSLSQPILSLIASTHQVSEGRFDLQIPVVRDDEIGELATSFNQMTAAIKRRDDALQAINQTLEKRVIERTKQLELAMREAQESSRLKDEFLATMSHELRTPLNAIIGFMGIIKMNTNLDERNLHRLARGRANAERLLNLINDILDISRIESGRLVLAPSHVDIRDLVDNLQSQMQVLAEEKDLAFEIHIDESLPQTILVDEDAVVKIVTNLLSNAFKFTSEGRVTLHIQHQDPNWVLTVTDTGIGIPHHKHEIIFERFRQVDGSTKRSYGGSGLGLAIVSNLCQVMGGTITLRSEPGQGSTFTVTLPLEAQTKLVEDYPPLTQPGPPETA